MEIKNQYNEYRVGAMFFKPVKTTREDLNDFVTTIRIGGGLRSWRLNIDCRALAGKLMAHDKLSDLIHLDSNDIILTLEIEHPKINTRILVGGNETATYVIYRRTSSKFDEKDLFKRLEIWIKKFLFDVQPLEHLLKYGRRDSFGLIPNNMGTLSYVIIRRNSYGEEKKEFGQPYTESTWSSDF